jgi:hypothetical protein
LKEKGLGLVDVVDVLDHWTQAYPTSAVLQKCVFDLIDAACGKASRSCTLQIEAICLFG